MEYAFFVHDIYQIEILAGEIINKDQFVQEDVELSVRKIIFQSKELNSYMKSKAYQQIFVSKENVFEDLENCYRALIDRLLDDNWELE